MGGTKYNRLLGNKFVTRYRNSLAYISSSIKLSNLMKLKIPKLEDTFSRYLNALKPLLTEAEWKQTEEITRKFQNGPAIQLDKEIRDLDSQDKNSNYISEPWFDMYLKAREPIVLNYNPFIAWKPDPNPSQMNQAIRATNLLVASARFLKSLRENKLKPEIFHINPEKSDTVMFQRMMKFTPEFVSFYAAAAFNAYPLDMSQYFRLFNSTRIPKKNKDILLTDETKNHILVLHRGNFFVFPVFGENGEILPPEELLACFHHILNSNLKEAEFPLGVLTTENRDTWAGIREKLEALGNRDALNAIDTSLYCIALDDLSSDDPNELSPNFLYGDIRNRWFDKNHTVIVSKNAQAAINFEHSWGDGVAVLRFFNELFDDSTKNPHVTSATKPSVHKGDLVKKLEFNLDDEVKNAIKTAQVSFQSAVKNLSLLNFELNQYGRNLAKKVNLSPDSVMQSAIQVAYFKVFGKIVTTYESASTSAFKYGRTETIRPVTLATNRLSEYLRKNTKDDDVEEIIKLMKSCTKIHNQLVKEGAMGQGFDRHLFAMKYHVAVRKKENLPEFYNSHAYKLINHNILSTSTLAYPTILTGGFAPVVPDGFGIGYRILDDSLGACVSSYNSADLKLFVKALEETYERFYHIFKKSKVEKKKDD